MSLAEQQTSRPNGLGVLASRIPLPKADGLERITRHPRAVLPLGSSGGMDVHTDRVRAKPALSPTVSMNIGITAIGLGLWGALFPGHVKKTLGIRAPASVVQTVFGARELWSGFTLAGDPTKSGMLWGRVAGDVFDIVALKSLDNPSNPKRGAARAALGFVLAVTALDTVTALRMSNVQRTRA